VLPTSPRGQTNFEAAANQSHMASRVLEMESITRTFPGVIALDSVDLGVGEGEIVALIGENGAGKSTLMKILGGVHQPDSGSISVDGRATVIASVRDAIDLGIAFIHQELNLLDNLDVAGNVYLGREPTNGGFLKLVDRKKMETDTKVYLDRLGLTISPRDPVRNLSIAQRQMVEIAKALSLDARILIMDEPTSSLTLTETSRLLAVTRDLRSQGVSIIYISHRMSEIQEIADRVVVLRDGKNAGQLERSEISHSRMVGMMVGRDLDQFYAPATDTESPVCFEINDLRTARYPNCSVSFSLREGEILCFAGLVGAGRSEMAQAIFGVDRRQSGEFKLAGAPIKIASPADAIAHRVYLVPEDRRRCGLILGMTIRENITLPALKTYAYAGLLSPAAERRAASDIFSRLRVKAPSIEARAGNLSGGNQQKVVLAKWLSLGPKVLIFDEPTRGIDVGAKAEIYHLMRELAATGVAIIVISSDMEEVLGISDRVAVMHEGMITGMLAKADCSEETIMRLAIGHVGQDASDVAHAPGLSNAG
jgi:ribose transport system ATP-binding protein